MKIDLRLESIFEKAWNSVPLDREDCKYLLSIDEKSYEGGLIRSTASAEASATRAI